MAAIGIIPDGSMIAEAGRTLAGFSKVERSIISEARAILASPKMDTIRAAQASGKPVSVTIGGRLVQYEPGLPASGMTMFGENGFLIGREAFTSKEELNKTVLHELFRLETSKAKKGVSAELAKKETQDASSFADRASNAMGGDNAGHSAAGGSDRPDWAGQ
ncbi:hypothetical protein MESS2_p40001 [Mesorhizobium metallidurans STM 2683]|uniref:Uncharacterized protein n=2 Tax=Mesorhizobium metallidurans TaxID=489722 RepID=M5EZ95_9HYPH|nr:hypothetical protein MESS2_p40001 [Mesorhizobium metallidurans STM 2683]